MGHDAINCSIIIEQRLKRFGMPKECVECNGHGYVYTEPEPRLTITFWVLHPRKGCGRAVTVKSIRQEQIPEVIEFLKKCHADATKNNWQRVLDFNGTYPAPRGDE